MGSNMENLYKRKPTHRCNEFGNNWLHSFAFPNFGKWDGFQTNPTLGKIFVQLLKNE